MTYKNTHYETIYESALKLLFQLTPEKTYATIVQEAKRLVNAKYSTIFLVEHNKLKRVYASSPILYQVTPRKNGKAMQVYKTHKPYLISPTELIQAHPEFEKMDVGSDLLLPLTYSNKAFGVLAVFSHKDKLFTEKELSILRLFTPVASLAIRNMQLYSEVKKSLEERDLFISMAAHELKTPLTTISLYSQLLLRKKPNMRYSQTEIKLKLLSDISRLTSLVNELLQVNRIKKGSLQFEMAKCDLYEIIKRAMTTFRNVYSNNPVKFSTQLKKTHCFIKGDYDKVLQVFTNLLNNAAKFSPKMAPIDISLSYNAPSYTVTITDYGEGIEKKDLPHIFNQFYKSSEKKEGLGLGLFLVKNIIDRHKGTITVSSSGKKGTTFSIALPIYQDNKQ